MPLDVSNAEVEYLSSEDALNSVLGVETETERGERHQAAHDLLSLGQGPSNREILLDAAKEREVNNSNYVIVCSKV